MGKEKLNKETSIEMLMQTVRNSKVLSDSVYQEPADENVLKLRKKINENLKGLIDLDN